MKISHIWVVSPPGNPHVHAFDDVACSFSASLQELGHPAIVTTEMPECCDVGDTVLLFAPHLLPSFLMHDQKIMPPSMILYNAEQLSDAWVAGSRERQDYMNFLRRAGHRVWDYSRKNIMYLKGNGIEADLCEIGHHPVMERIIKAEDPDIDVLFYGSLNGRRLHILREMNKAGIRTEVVFGKYGPALDALIARAKIVLNMHFYPTALFEIFRCSTLMANRIPIVSETGFDACLENSYLDAVMFCDYKKLVSTCVSMLSCPASLSTVGNAGYDAFKARRQIDFLRPLVAA